MTTCKQGILFTLHYCTYTSIPIVGVEKGTCSAYMERVIKGTNYRVVQHMIDDREETEYIVLLNTGQNSNSIMDHSCCDKDSNID